VLGHKKKGGGTIQGNAAGNVDNLLVTETKGRDVEVRRPNKGKSVDEKG